MKIQRKGVKVGLRKGIDNDKLEKREERKNRKGKTKKEQKNGEY